MGEGDAASSMSKVSTLRDTRHAVFGPIGAVQQMAYTTTRLSLVVSYWPVSLVFGIALLITWLVVQGRTCDPGFGFNSTLGGCAPCGPGYFSPGPRHYGPCWPCPGAVTESTSHESWTEAWDLAHGYTRGCYQVRSGCSVNKWTVP